MDQSDSYFTISDLAKELDVKKSHIRLCEENRLIPPRASKLKRRVYNRYDRERLKFVFHFVLLGYSKEQIIDLIGMADANLNENDQLIQGIEYALKELKKLEKRKEELSFTKQTRTINEIEMLREYIKKIKIIKSGVLEEPSTRPRIRFEDKAKIPTKPVMALTAEAEKKPAQHPVKVISLFVAGCALVIFIGSYFYYQASQKETKSIKLAQKKPMHSGKILVQEASEPLDQTPKVQGVTPEAQKNPESTSSTQLESANAQSTDDSFDVAIRNGEKQSESDANLFKNEKLEENQLGAGITDTVSKGDGIQAVIVKEKIPSQSSKEMPVTAGDAKAPEKQALFSPEVQEAPKDDVQKEIAGEDLSENAAPTAIGKDTLTAELPEAVKEKATDIEFEEAPESESAEETSPLKDGVSLVQERERLGSPKVEETLKDDVKQGVDSERVKENAGSAAAGEDTLTAAIPQTGVEKMAETEVKPSLTEAEKEQIASEENINQQKNELSRLKSFLNDYCQAYTNRDLYKFKTFFTSDATENNKPFHERLPDHRKNMEGKESFTYRIELISYSKQTDSKNLIIRGRFFTRYQTQKGVWKEDNGSIFMELLENGDSFLVKQLNYRN